jgi:tetratricopeptide (TPR) repeat protein
MDQMIRRTLRLLAILTLFVSAAVAQTTSDYNTLVQKGKTQLQAGTADLALASGEEAIKMNADRWEGYALAGGALMNLKRYEGAADKFSKAIEKAPEAKQAALRDLRRQCLVAESGASPAAKESAPATTSQAEIVLWKSIEKSSSAADFQAYVDQYPHGAFVVLAQRHLADARAQAEGDQRRLNAQAEQERQELIGKLTWADPSTGLMWGKPTPRPRGMNFADATDYCAKSRLAQYSDYRLPTADELQRIYHKGDWLEPLVTCDVWTASRGDTEGEHVLFQWPHGLEQPPKRESRKDEWQRGCCLCVRDSEKIVRQEESK